MNTRPPIETAPSTVVLSVSFNNDASCFSVGLNTGICIFHTKSCLLKASKDFNGGIGLVEMMGTTNYLALVGGGRQPKFSSSKAIIWDGLKSKVAMEISSLTPVRGVRIGRNRIVVALQNSVRVYSFAKPPDLQAVYETTNNPFGLCCLSEKTIAFPGRTVGQVQLVDIGTGNVSIIPAHSSALRAIQLSPDGESLATASEQGTLIRVFATSNCAKVAELRRGVDPATIFSLGFSPEGTKVACTSDKSTLHVFDVPHPKRGVVVPTSPSASMAGSGILAGRPGDDGRGRWGFLGKIPLMPRMFSDVYSFASAPFEAGDDPFMGSLPLSEQTPLGTTRPQKGVIGWINEESLVVIGAGQDARWEKFIITKGEDGRRYLTREGWKRYLGSG
ncbi:SVP1-like protein 2 [Colletotrichum sp. SAR11_239]|uniref:WD repeat domain-containing phosphoinositide-interacting protein 4 n=1 Tax=Colletotrichum asianum TaxID=702518 RepID=A0A8H3W8T8_9PEZI|nr:WD repeat domain-containing phosphoinositide-interacting protein 4 [Colletotrichum asianum]KAI8265161.1 SVP1-like protein 2 [Colletotrichum sp. SAR11_239]KAI8281416.1 SVP1-like protein 2 [Colletotrichum sp. SAR11_240]